MKLYGANAGNAKRVRIFIAEKRIELPRETLDLGTDTRSPEYLKINSLVEVPALALDDGQIITESMAISRYLELIYPDKILMRKSPIEQAQIEMWSQRIFWQLFLPIGQMVRHELPLFSNVLEQVPEFAAAQRRAMPGKWRWLDREMSDGRRFIVGNSFSFADIQGMVPLMLGDIFDLSVPGDCKNVLNWANSLRRRSSWTA
ncbi:glutathione S-transferase family protein [Parasphingorhabdus cellanae]|uniref:Glutathione S-transferase family protein n=1 Tax=Parasphingorhabdus cellanae TaxID=2806553 RepID=A0ABX7TA81_9SPHN|nr:glutathione S-transferase family protein [Parasphingorhabdus cellanae]QTD57330.1 glutathione S-transferase family protein [Parasphingorhabdus cellanae]